MIVPAAPPPAARRPLCFQKKSRILTKVIFLSSLLLQAEMFLWKNTCFFHFFAFFLKNDKDFHEKCYWSIDFDEKRNGFLTFVALCLKNNKDFH